MFKTEKTEYDAILSRIQAVKAGDTIVITEEDKEWGEYLYLGADEIGVYALGKTKNQGVPIFKPWGSIKTLMYPDLRVQLASEPAEKKQ